MSDQNIPPADNPQGGAGPGDEVLDELRALGQNLADLLRGAWESDERKRLQDEIQKGLGEVTTTLSRVATDISQSSTGQAIKSDLDNLQERLHTGELEKQIRNEVLAGLRMANEGIKKAGGHSAGAAEPPPPPPADDQTAG